MKKTIEELRDEVNQANLDYRNKKFVHIKSNNIYYVIGVSIDCETNELRLQYEPCINWDLQASWSRPLSEFKEKFKLVHMTSMLFTKEELESVREMLGNRSY